MNSIRMATLLAMALATLSGCGTIRIGPAAQWPWSDDNNKPTKICNGTCTTSDALTAYLQASKYCKDIQNYYESGGQVSGATKLSLATVGAVAGSVIAPVAAGTAAKAWSGVSGATNAMQATFDQAFSSAIIAKRQGAVADAAKAGSDAFLQESDATKQVLIAVDMARSCSMSPAKADSDSMQKLLSQ